jgi:hypothetical protein
MLKVLGNLAITLGLSCGWSGSTILGSVVGATIAKLLGVKSLVIRTILKHVFIPLLGWVKQEEGVALVGGRIGASVRKKPMVDWKMCRIVVASEQSPSPLLNLLALSASKLDLISLGLGLNKMTTGSISLSPLYPSVTNDLRTICDLRFATGSGGDGLSFA